MKKKALIPKTQSQLPLKSVNKLMAGSIGTDEENSQPQHLGKEGQAVSESPQQSAKQTASVHQHHNEEDDYEDMMTPTDDEGITSLNHTQKIPISLIKAKDKASVSVNSNFLFCPRKSLSMD